jgi:hypothetical protein
VINAAVIPQSAITEPIPKSIPPVRITNVIPTAKIAISAFFTAIFTRFPVVRKLSEREANTMHSNRIAISNAIPEKRFSDINLLLD